METILSQNAPQRRNSGRDGRPPSPSIEQRLAALPAVANALGISTKTVWRILRAGDLPCVRIGARTMVSLADLDAYIARQRGAFVAKVA
jgi:excisionase family DNA binding protein